MLAPIHQNDLNAHIPNQLTLAWNMVELTKESTYWQGPDHLAQSLLGVWFAAAHQPWMNLDFITLTLSTRPDIQAALREEIGDFDALDYDRLHSLPLLDSFIKEVVRLHPLDKSTSPHAPSFFRYLFDSVMLMEQ